VIQRSYDYFSAFAMAGDRSDLIFARRLIRRVGQPGHCLQPGASSSVSYIVKNKHRFASASPPASARLEGSSHAWMEINAQAPNRSGDATAWPSMTKLPTNQVIHLNLVRRAAIRCYPRHQLEGGGPSSALLDGRPPAACGEKTSFLP